MIEVKVNPSKRFRDSKYQGVFYRESSIRIFKGKPDRCFDICYRAEWGRLTWEKIGWASEGYSAVMASQIRAERLRSIRHGEELPKNKPREVTLEEVWKKYDEWLNTGKKGPENDRGYYKKHIEPVLKDKPLSKISPFDIEKLKANLNSKNLAPATVKHVLIIIRQLINKAIAWGMWSGENPIKKVKLPRLNNRRERFLNRNEAQMILTEVQKVSQQTHDICLLSLHTGMRAGEIFDLKWSHIDFENELINVADPKGGRARKAFMTKTIIEMLKGLKKSEPEEYVFLSINHDRIDRISNSFMKAVNKLKLNEGITDPRQKIVFHTLRHTFASLLAIQGTPILTIKELLGHQSLAMTERYSHLIPDQKRDAVEGIEKVLGHSNLGMEGMAKRIHARSQGIS